MPGGVTTRAAEASQEPHWAQKLLGDLSHMQKVLPSKTELAKHYFSAGKTGNRNQLFRDIGQEVTAIWDHAGIPTMTQCGVFNKVQRFFDSKPFQYFLKNHDFQTGTNFDQLFDIASCRCFSSLSKIEDSHLIKCKCPSGKKYCPVF